MAQVWAGFSRPITQHRRMAFADDHAFDLPVVEGALGFLFFLGLLEVLHDGSGALVLDVLGREFYFRAIQGEFLEAVELGDCLDVHDLSVVEVEVLEIAELCEWLYVRDLCVAKVEVIEVAELREWLYVHDLCVGEVEDL
jgi:hypothetical protein